MGKLTGRVVTKGMITREYPLSTLCYTASLLSQDPDAQLVCPDVVSEIAFGPENYGIEPEEIRRRVKANIEAARLQGYEDRNPHTLSGGQQQSCILAAIMAVRPEIFVLDEPTSNLDPYGSIQTLKFVLELVRSSGKTMVIVEHKIEELAPYVDTMVLMDQGRIISKGEPRKVLEEADLMQRIGIKPPQASLLAAGLGNSGMDIGPTPITVEEAVAALSKLLRGLGKGAEKEKPSVVEVVARASVGQPRKPVIQVQDLWHTYKEGNVEALRGVSMEVYENDFLAIIGQNGSGKTTLVKHFNRLLSPTRGKVFVYGVDTTKTSLVKLSRRVGFCHQNPDHQLCNETVRQELEFGPRNLKIPDQEIKERVLEAAKGVALEHVLDRDPFELSKGERTRVAIASILTMKPDVLVVDEPTTGQDFQRARDIMSLMMRLNSEGKAIVIITHDMNLAAEYVNRVVVLKDGQILVEGPVRKVFSQTELLGTTYLRPPQVTLIGQALGNYGLPSDVLTVDEMYAVLKKRIGGT
jgi:energy-coupling factor transport system ATP-binding protein